MKKFFKFLIGIVAVAAGVAGCLFVYGKIKEKKEAYDDDFEDDYDDDFSDDADDEDRPYVNITADAETADKDAKAED